MQHSFARKKKLLAANNSSLVFDFASSVSLPPLRSASAAAPAPIGGTDAAAPAETVTPAPEPPKTAARSPAPASVTPPASATSPEPVAPPTAPVSPPARSTISGRTLSEIMSGGSAGGYTENSGADTQQATPVDPDAQEKIERGRERFLERLARERPRIGVAFETMEVSGNALRVRVASQTLHDEILRWRTETLHLLATVAGVLGSIELEVIVDETARPSRPIRLEDKVKHLSDLNPEFNTLRRTLDMEIE